MERATVERATGIEPAFSAWEAEDGSFSVTLKSLINDHFLQLCWKVYLTRALHGR